MRRASEPSSMTFTWWSVMVCVAFLAAVPPCVPSMGGLRRSVHRLQAHSSSSPGADALGFADSLRQPSSGAAYQLSTQVLFGANALEHGINLLEERAQVHNRPY